MRKIFIFLFSVFSFLTCFLLSGDKTKGTEAVIEVPEDFDLKNCCTESSLSEEDRLTAYIQGLLDGKYAKYGVIVTVRNGHVLLSNLPEDPIRTEKIINFVKKITSISNIVADVPTTEGEIPPVPQEPMFTVKDCTGTWLPQSTTLFPTQIANPRNISFSVGPRFHDAVGGNVGTAFSFGDQFPLYRWTNVWRWKGDVQLEVEAGLFAVFNHDDKTFPMQNADYYAGLPLTYAKGPWAFRARLYHVSSHLGDEYMDTHRDFKRKNKSFEAIDFCASRVVNDTLHVYGGLGSVIHYDDEMYIKPLYIEYGIELRGKKHNFSQLYGRPFIAIHVQNAQQHHFKFDPTLAIGYEWSKIQGFGRKVRCYFEVHTGFSPDGQFSNLSTTYYALRLAYGF